MKDPVLEGVCVGVCVLDGVTVELLVFEGDLVLELVNEPVLEGVWVTDGVRVRLPDLVCVPERVPVAVLEGD